MTVDDNKNDIVLKSFWYACPIIYKFLMVHIMADVSNEINIASLMRDN